MRVTETMRGVFHVYSWGARSCPNGRDMIEMIKEMDIKIRIQRRCHYVYKINLMQSQEKLGCEGEISGIDHVLPGQANWRVRGSENRRGFFIIGDLRIYRESIQKSLSLEMNDEN